MKLERLVWACSTFTRAYQFTYNPENQKITAEVSVRPSKIGHIYIDQQYEIFTMDFDNVKMDDEEFYTPFDIQEWFYDYFAPVYADRYPMHIKALILFELGIVDVVRDGKEPPEFEYVFVGGTCKKSTAKEGEPKGKSVVLAASIEDAFKRAEQLKKTLTDIRVFVI